MKIVMFSGSGGTGKSTVAKALAEQLPGWYHVPSLTRQAYAEAGYPSQIALNVLPVKEQQQAQSFFFKHFLDNSYKIINDKKREGVPGIIFERTPCDHAAYAAMVHDSIVSFEMACLGYYSIVKPDVFYFPYPAPWGGQADGFRNVDPVNDARIAATIQGALDETTPYTIVEPFEIEERVSFIRENLGV